MTSFINTSRYKGLLGPVSRLALRKYTRYHPYPKFHTYNLEDPIYPGFLYPDTCNDMVISRHSLELSPGLR